MRHFGKVMVAVRSDKTKRVCTNVCRCGKEVLLLKQSIMVAFLMPSKLMNLYCSWQETTPHISEDGRCAVLRRSNALDIALF